MDDAAAIFPEHPAFPGQGGVSRAPVSLTRMADAIRALAIDAEQTARAGHAGTPYAMADIATALWLRVLRYDAADPRWPDRDRFVLSAGDGAMLLYALVHLTGHDGFGMEALRRFRRLHSPAAGQPEFGLHPAIEASTGPLGQGLASAVGMALAERMLAARFGRSLVDHRTWVIACDGDLMEGISHEAVALAGHLRLAKLCVLWDASQAADPAGEPACSVDQQRRFAACGWAVRQVDAAEEAQVGAALSFAIRSRKPTLIACTASAAPAPPRSGAEAQAVKDALGWPSLPFQVPEEIAARWRAAGRRGSAARRAWLKRLARHPLRAEFERAIAGRLPDAWQEPLAALRARVAEQRPAISTREAARRAVDALAGSIPELVGGATGAPRGEAMPNLARLSPGSYAGRAIGWGLREHGMAAAMNGMALHGGIIPFGSSPLAFSDYLRPALRLAAQMRQRVIHVLTDDGIGSAEEGPSCQAVEQLAALRAMPNIFVFRPADALETAECWELAIRRTDGPSVLALTRHAVPALRGASPENASARGGYVLAEAEGPRRATLLATGSEVTIAMAAREMLTREGIPVAVVSLPCWELFALGDAAYRAGVLGTAPRVAIEAGCGFGWERWLGEDGSFVGMTGFGASGPHEELYRHFGMTPEAVATAVRRRLTLSG
jgi:transketolase